MSSIAEEWRALPWDRQYEVSSLGAVRTRINATHPERRQIAPMRMYADKDGYLCLRIRGQKWLAHRLVYRVFCGDLIAGLVVCHIDGDPANNAVGNLLQATQRENISHKISHGTHQAGSMHGRAIYSEGIVSEVKAAVAAAPRSALGRMRRGTTQEIAGRFGVGRDLVRVLATGRGWRHVQ